MRELFLLAALAMVAAGRTLTDVGGSPDPSFIIDLANLQWWQTLGLVLTAAGLSPAPWILGLAVNRIQFTKTADAAHAAAIAEIKEAHDREVANLTRYHESVVAGKDQRYSDLQETNQRNIEAAESQRLRADEMTAALAQAAEAITATNHILDEFKSAAEEATPNG